MRPEFTKFPVFFPVSRESRRGTGTPPVLRLFSGGKRGSDFGCFPRGQIPRQSREFQEFDRPRRDDYYRSFGSDQRPRRSQNAGGERGGRIPMKRAYFDCFSGISGDMTLGALVDSGVDPAALENELRRLPVSGWQLSTARVKRRGIAATQVKVDAGGEHAHRGLGEILAMIDAAGYASRVADRASRIFVRLGESEARIHGVAIEKVHFHEVGAVDSIVDIVGSAIGFEMLGIDEFYFSPLNVGAGTVRAAHGVLPVPAPATADLLRGAPVYSTGIELEMVTPTGAAIAATLADGFGPMPPMQVETAGYGAGSADPPSQANVLRLIMGESAGVHAASEEAQTVSVIEANVDDMSPQVYGYFAEQARKAGALEVYCVAAQMKKGRPGMLLTVVCAPAKRAELVDLIFRETTIIGVRTQDSQRETLEREIVPVETAYGRVGMKVSRRNGVELNAAPEYEDCARIAAERSVPLKGVLAEASREYARMREAWTSR
jgi:uncharacterized protein (TIGR00299 family) protein